MARVRLADEIMAKGRAQLLDLREAVTLPPPLRQPARSMDMPRRRPPKPVPERRPRTGRALAMNDVFRYGQDTGVPAQEVAAPEVTPVEVPAPAVPESSSRAAPAARPPMINRRRIIVLGQYPLIALIAIGAAYSASIGQWFVLAYGVVALIRRLDSRYSFGSAIFLLVTVPLFQALGQSGIAQNVAIYVFELLVIGTIQAVLELRKVGEEPS